MKKDHAAIDRAIQEVKDGFPFPEIIDQTMDTIRPIAVILQDLMPDGGRVLDLGCGALDKAMVLQKIGYQCCGADDFQDAWHRNRDNLDPVVAFAQSLGIEVHAQHSPFEIPWDKDSFDAVTIVNVIEHLHESPRDLLNFAGAHIKPDGLLIIVMPNSVNLRKRLSVITGRTNYTPNRGLYEFEGLWRGHTREYTLDETAEIVEWTGFDVIAKSTFHGLLRNRVGNPMVQAAFRCLSWVAPRLRDTVMVVGRKPADWAPREPDPDAMRSVAGHEGFA